MERYGMNAEYNGWVNYETWSVALTIHNDQSLYLLAKDFVRQAKEQCCAVDPEAHCLGANLYDEFIEYANLRYSTTPELVAWFLPCLDRESLRGCLIELLKH